MAVLRYLEAGNRGPWKRTDNRNLLMNLLRFGFSRVTTLGAGAREGGAVARVFGQRDKPGIQVSRPQTCIPSRGHPSGVTARMSQLINGSASRTHSHTLIDSLSLMETASQCSPHTVARSGVAPLQYMGPRLDAACHANE